MASYYQTPPRQQSFQSVPGNPSLESNMNLYSDLPSELRSRPASAQSRSRTPYDNTPSNNSGYQSTSVARSVSGPVGRGGQAGRAEPPVSTENLAPIPRAARTLNDYLTQEARYPELDNIVSREYPSQWL